MRRTLLILFLVMALLGAMLGAAPLAGSQPNEWDHAEPLIRWEVPLLNQFWNDTFKNLGEQYRPVKRYEFYEPTLVDGNIQTACGNTVTEAWNAFYCTRDESIYMHGKFMDLQFTQFATNPAIGDWGDMAAGVIMAHEWAHHVQWVLVAPYVKAIVRGRVMELELQADCYAGLFFRALWEVDLIDQADIQEGADALAFLGDNEQVTIGIPDGCGPAECHGTAEQRRHWFNVGVQQFPNMDACDTFAAFT